jgi:AraC family transcriptional regulator
MIFTYLTNDCTADGFTQLEIPEATWAIFKSESHSVEETSKVTQSLIKRVYTDWLPTANYKKIDGYDLEFYHCCGDDGFYSETWIRVEPK